MTVVQTVLVYVLIPAVIYGVIALLTLAPKMSRAPRYRPGQKWIYEPVWWGSRAGKLTSPGGTGSATPADQLVRTARGGARGSW